MFRLTLEEILDLPSPSILTYLRSKEAKLSSTTVSRTRSNEVGCKRSDHKGLYSDDIITAIIFYKRDYLLREDNRQIVLNPDFVRTLQLPNTKLIQMMNEQKEEISIFTTKAEILRSLLHSEKVYLGQLMTFGNNEFGQLGLGDRSIRKDRLVDSLNEQVKMVSCGNIHTAIITESGKLMTFGNNQCGQSGLDKEEDVPDILVPTLVEIPNNERVKMVSCGGSYTAIITESGKLMTFGGNEYGQLGLGDKLGTGTYFNGRPTLVEIPNNERVKMVSCGGSHTAIITESGKLMTFGDNEYGQLGLGYSGYRIHKSIPTLVEIPDNERVEMVSCGNEHTAIINGRGELMTFGSNKIGQLGLDTSGIGNLKNIPTLVKLENYEGIKMVSCGRHHTAIITESGQLMSFGENMWGQLGLGDSGSRTYRVVPTLINMDETVKMVNCGGFHTAIITENGKLMIFGYNQYGQVGLGYSSIKTVVPTLVGSVKDKKVKTVSCGLNHTAIIV